MIHTRPDLHQYHCDQCGWAQSMSHEKPTRCLCEGSGPAEIGELAEAAIHRAEAIISVASAEFREWGDSRRSDVEGWHEAIDAFRAAARAVHEAIGANIEARTPVRKPSPHDLAECIGCAAGFAVGTRGVEGVNCPTCGGPLRLVESDQRDPLELIRLRERLRAIRLLTEGM